MAARRLDSLTGLRAFAALAVFASHAALTESTARFVRQGNIGVSFFFLLSGFVLMWVFDDAIRSSTFFRRRFARIYPAYIAAWIISVPARWHAGFPYDLPAILPGIGLFQSWIPSERFNYAYNSVSWSTSCEVFFYLTLPLWAHRLAAMRSTTRRLLALAAVTAIFAIGFGGELVASYSAAPTPYTDLVDWTMFTLPPVRLLEFVLGAWLAVEMRSGARFPVPLGVALTLGIAAYLLPAFWPDRITSIAIPTIPLLMIIGASAQAELDGRRTVFSTRMAVWAGGISYSFYLVHQLITVEVLNHHPMPLPLGLGVMLGLSVAAASLMHYAVERPCERWIRGRPTQHTASDLVTTRG